MKGLPPGSKIGILGGGQLGRMLALEARRMGYRTIVLDPTPDSPAGQAADEQIVAKVDDPDSAERLAQACDLVTLEWELIPAPVLERVAALKPARPAAAVLELIQDRLVQKDFLGRHGFTQARYMRADGAVGWPGVLEAIGVPAIVKTRRAGYDGKGQRRIRTLQDAASASTLLQVPCIVERVVEFEKEISVIAARGLNGETAVFPLAENEHRNGILHTTLAPARVSDEVQRQASAMAKAIADKLGHVGVLCVEMFLAGGELLVNEIAPRVHNSGHFTWRGCATSQFEQHLRAVCGLPLGDTRQLTPVVMLNLLGELWQDGEPRWDKALSRPGVELHLYGKAKPAPGRKMGHLLILGEAPEQALAVAAELHAELGHAAR